MTFRFETANERWKWFLRRKSDYNGWTNWDTWHTALLIDNEQVSQSIARGIVNGGGSVQDLAEWALKTIVGPTNQRTLRENPAPKERGEGALQCFDCGLRGEREEFGEGWPTCPSCHGSNVWSWRENDNADTQHPKSVRNHLIEDSQINWEEIYQHYLPEE